MRALIDEQIRSGEIDITKIKVDEKSRDDIPQILLGIQYLYREKATRKQLLDTLEKLIPPDVDKSNGRPGMSLWRIFVLGLLRLNLNWDYDRLQEMANNHHRIRQMLGHVGVDAEHYYHVQTLKDNLHLFTPEILEALNQVIVESGHALFKKSALT